MKHSTQRREFLITAEGIQLQDVYVGPEGVLTGSMRAAQEAREAAAAAQQTSEAARRQRALQAQRASLDARMAVLRSELEALDGESGGVLPHPPKAAQRKTS
jgi:circadian clock protein KaiC